MGRLAQEMDSDDRRFGSGWTSGMLSIVLGTVGLGTVLCLMYPQLLTVPEIHTLYSEQVVGLIRLALHVVLIAAFAFGILSITLRQSKTLGFAGMAIVLVAALMGGSRASRHMTGETDVYFGLDFFLLNLILLGTIFIPIERLFRRNEQPIFRDDWREDLLYFFISSLFVQSLTYMSLTPSLQFVKVTDWASGFREMVASQPLIVQFFEIMFVTDFVQYWFHLAVEISRGAPFRSKDGLGCRLAHARLRDRPAASLHYRPDVLHGLRRVRVVRVHFLRLSVLGIRAFEPAISLRIHAVHSVHAEISPLAPRHRERIDQHQLRCPLPDSRPNLRHVSHAGRGVAHRLRDLRPPRATRILLAVQVPVSEVDED